MISSRDLLDRHFLRIADVDRVVLLRQHQPDDAVDQIADVAEAARLRAVAEHRDVLVDERLRDERRHRAAVADAHARAVGVEDADDLGVELVIAAIRHRHRFGKPLGFVVDAARANRVDVAPVGFLLRMLERIAVDLGGRGDHEHRASSPWPGRAPCACRARRLSASGSAARDSRSGWPGSPSAARSPPARRRRCSW